jgi:ATP-dependent Clp protease adapter protein ClpS
MDTEILIENPHQVETGHGKSGEPKPWAVIVHDDDTTPVHEVISILRLHFNYTTELAIELVVDAQEDGEAEVQIYKARDMAETKAGQAMDVARWKFLELRFSVKPV